MAANRPDERNLVYIVIGCILKHSEHRFCSFGSVGGRAFDGLDCLGGIGDLGDFGEFDAVERSSETRVTLDGTIF